MKIKGAKQVHYDSGPNMTPLVDVVMVILIFLMLAGSFGGTEQYLESNMPITNKGVGKSDEKPKLMDDPQLEIYVDSAGGTYTAHPTGLPGVSDGDSLIKELVQTKVKLGKGKVGPDDKDETTQVIISPGQSVKYQFLIDVYQAALEAKFTKVGFATGR